MRYTILTLLLVLCLLLGACGLPENSPEPSLVPAFSRLSRPPHEHDIDPETGLCRFCFSCGHHKHIFDDSYCCRICGEACAHEHGFDEDGVCLDCRWRCSHETHDPETALCPVCGVQCCHHFGMDLVCARCGREAPLFFDTLPERFFGLSAHRGRCLTVSVPGPTGADTQLAIYLPYGYRTDKKYNLCVMLHGDGGACDVWTDQELPVPDGPIQFCALYDYMLEQHLCEPFIVVGVDATMMQYGKLGVSLIRDTVLPYMAEHYATWMASGTEEDIRAAREHIAIGGLSSGSAATYVLGMGYCLDLSANFCCFSNAKLPGMAAVLNREENAPYDILSYVATIGLRDRPMTRYDHQMTYEALCRDCERVTDGESARFFGINQGHNYLTWTASFYDALLLMFPEE